MYNSRAVKGTEKTSETERYGVLAQLGEHLPYKQRVIGSSPIGPIFMPDNLKTLWRDSSVG